MDGRRRFSWPELLFWLALVILLTWAILKSFFIHTEPWIIYFPPAISIFLLALSFWGKLTSYGERIRNIERNIYAIRKIEERFIKLETEHNMILSGKTKIKH